MFSSKTRLSGKWQTRLACASVVSLMFASCTSKPSAAVNEPTMLLAPATTQPALVADKDLVAAQKKFSTLITKAVATSQPAIMEHRGQFVDDAYADIDFSAITIDQGESIMSTMPVVVLGPKTSVALRQAVSKSADLPTQQGARAAVLQIGLLPRTAKPDEKAKQIVAAINHPGMESAIAAGRCAEIFSYASELPPQDLFQVRPRLIKLGDSVRIDAPPMMFVSISQFFTNISRELKNEEIKTFSPLRQRTAKIATAKAKMDTDMLKRVNTTLNSVFVKGEMIGSPATDIDFLWYNNPADASQKITSLSQLKGKVVVLDFWATWCVPCQMSFPRMAALSNYYKGYEVAFVGVTSPQGFVISKGKRVTTTDHEKEFALTADFAVEKKMTWPIAESKQDVFNPDYGVYGIPDVVIIDAQGVVRFANMNPLEAESVASDSAIINSLLAEAKMPIPTAPVPATPKIVFPGMRPAVAASQPSATSQPTATTQPSATTQPVVQAN